MKVEIIFIKKIDGVTYGVDSNNYRNVYKGSDGKWYYFDGTYCSDAI